MYSLAPHYWPPVHNVSCQIAFLMAAVTLVPAAEAAAFTLGCAFIHAQRHRAELLTEILAVVTVIALLLTASLTVPEEELNKATLATALSEVGALLPPSFE